VYAECEYVDTVYFDLCNKLLLFDTTFLIIILVLCC